MSKFDMVPGSTGGALENSPEKPFSSTPPVITEKPQWPENKGVDESAKEKQVNAARVTLGSVMEKQARAIREDVEALGGSQEELIDSMVKNLGLNPVEFEKKMAQLAWKRKTLPEKAVAIFKKLGKRITGK